MILQPAISGVISNSYLLGPAAITPSSTHIHIQIAINMPGSFLLIGIAWDELAGVVGEAEAPEMTKKVKAAIARDTESFKEAGLELDFIAYGTQEPMQRLEEQLRGKEYKGVAM